MEKNGFINDCFVTYDLSIRPIWICERAILNHWYLDELF